MRGVQKAPLEKRPSLLLSRPGAVASLQVVDLAEAHLFEDLTGAATAAPALAIYDRGFRRVELLELLAKITAVKIVVDRSRDVASADLLGGSHIDQLDLGDLGEQIPELRSGNKAVDDGGAVRGSRLIRFGRGLTGHPATKGQG